MPIKDLPGKWCGVPGSPSIYVDLLAMLVMVNIQLWIAVSNFRQLIEQTLNLAMSK
ncbi:MAG: hypothetical protein NTW32_06510 [Chloroflexi bacterium]|nr:hypothetical protein [Chloroflexota bacterium]